VAITDGPREPAAIPNQIQRMVVARQLLKG